MVAAIPSRLFVYAADSPVRVSRHNGPAPAGIGRFGRTSRPVWAAPPPEAQLDRDGQLLVTPFSTQGCQEGRLQTWWLKRRENVKMMGKFAVAAVSVLVAGTVIPGCYKDRAKPATSEEGGGPDGKDWLGGVTPSVDARIVWESRIVRIRQENISAAIAMLFSQTYVELDDRLARDFAPQLGDALEDQTIVLVRSVAIGDEWSPGVWYEEKRGILLLRLTVDSMEEARGPIRKNPILVILPRGERVRDVSIEIAVIR